MSITTNISAFLFDERVLVSSTMIRDNLDGLNLTKITFIIGWGSSKASGLTEIERSLV